MRDQRHFETDRALIHSRDPQGGAPSDLVLDPAVRVLWRSAEQVQLELGARSVIVDGVDQASVRRLTGQPGELPDPALLDDAVDALRAAGFLMRRSRPDRATQVPRLAAEFAALRVRHAERADDLLASRRASTVAINGTSRITAIIGALLGAAGVGHVSIAGEGDVRLHQTAPGGLLPSDEGQRFATAAAAAVTRAAPDCDTSPAPVGLRPDLVVLAADRPIDTELRDGLHARGTPHLVAWTGADHGGVGPLALPGVASCLRCADLHRLDRDPAWSALAVQLAVPPRHGHPSDVSLASLIASIAAVQALTFLAGDDPPTIEGTLEIQLPDWRIRRRGWAPHPDCDCGALSAQNVR
jgi:bacteriocin biosynthesis cyclodehydratase domain-containing protein